MDYDTIYDSLSEQTHELIGQLMDDAAREDDEVCNFTDNFRIARKDRPEEVKAYNAASARGCCGFFDDEIDTPDGVILFGWNFGH